MMRTDAMALSLQSAVSRKILYFFLAVQVCLVGGGCKTAQNLTCCKTEQQISVAIRVPEDQIKISDQALPPGIKLDENGAIILPSEEMTRSWKEKHLFSVDLIVEITNTSRKSLIFFRESNSWGYCNLKLVFSNSFHELVLHKKPGVFYGNFPSQHVLPPGKSFRIPVALADPIWEHADVCKKGIKQEDKRFRIHSVRALYEQHPGSLEHFSIRNGIETLWRGSVSSPTYAIEKLELLESCFE